MNIIVPKELKILSSLFALNGTPLYIVGGYVRNAVLGIYKTDIDTAADSTPEEVIKLLSGTQFSCKEQSKKMGTLKIYSSKNFECEYTAFRNEQYSEGGNHKPITVSFKTDIIEDAKRRDFTCNALYYDIQKQKIIDFYNGQKHTLEHTLKVISDSVFESDGLRLLRLIRQSAELNFRIDAHTFNLACKEVDKLKDISAERIRVEFEFMLNADEKYGIGNHMLAMERLLKIGAAKYVYKTNSVKFKYLRQCEEISRLTALIIDMGLKEHDVFVFMGAKGLKFSNRIINKTTLAVSAFYELKGSVKSALSLRLFIQKYYTVLDILLGLKYKNIQIEKQLQIMRSKNMPISLSELNISGITLMRYFPKVTANKIGIILHDLLCFTAKNGNLNKQNLLLNKVGNDIKQNKYL
ncbi:MAG: hypothetical protein WCX32_01025 [Clostridia bacterium]|jgi:tRNA nucleotidyltransferase (CCA-adding enzyme)|nr:hypothetical protein [Clostridia bacterium]